MNTKQQNQPRHLNKTLRYFLLIFGTLSLILGIIGIVIPLLPTTPFLLLTAICYARASQKAYTWLIHNRWFGTYIKNYQDGNGIPLKVKIYTILFLWITIIISIITLRVYLITVLLITIAILVTMHLLIIKTMKKL
jgi:uncharacterized membrane protein YbaN (DUF454 family)